MRSPGRIRRRRVYLSLLGGVLAAWFLHSFETPRALVNAAAQELGLAPHIAATVDWLDSVGLAFAAAEGPAVSYRHGVVERGEVFSTVTATGTLQPAGTVMVGTEVAGQIRDVIADFNSIVTRGEVIARIDPVSFELAVEQAEADLEVALSVLQGARADLQRAHADYEIATSALVSAQADANRVLIQVEDYAKDSERKQRLASNGSLPRSEYERAQATHAMALASHESMLAQYESRAAALRGAQASVKAAESRIANAEGSVLQRRAALRQAEINLERTIIRSPVEGVVIHRGVEPGQTVAEMAQDLFIIAQDLRKMRVEASIDESEIGRIVPGQKVDFAVDAYHGHRFFGTVVQVRLSPKNVQNVVTYTVIVAADNPDLLLLPGMTATARFLVAERQDVLKVPTAALRLRLPSAPSPAGQGVVWVEDNGRLKQIPVDVGLTDGVQTEVDGEGLLEGMAVVVGVEQPRQAGSRVQRLFGGS